MPEDRETVPMDVDLPEAPPLLLNSLFTTILLLNLYLGVFYDRQYPPMDTTDDRPQQLHSADYSTLYNLRIQ